MALDLGELSIALELDNDRMRAGMAEAKRELETLPPVAQREMVKVTREMDRGGKDAGGKLAQGINQGLIRNSPLIVAGIGAALTVGAPAVLAASATLFGGIGIAAAAQNDEVRAAWAGLGDFMLGQVADVADPIVDTTTRMADKTAAAFLRVKPAVIGAVSAVTPQIDDLFDSVVAMGENALPGMVRAAENAGPAMSGLGSFLESTGTGVGDFFAAISEHSDAAGTSMAELGTVVGEMLPTLAVLIGHGVELASVVLPPLADAMGLVRDVAEDLGPALPYVAAGLLALNASRGIAGGLENLAGRLTRVGTEGSVVDRSTNRAARGLSAMGSALPLLGVGLVGIAEGMRQADEQVSELADNLLKGGAAAAETERLFRAVGQSDVGADVIAKTRAEVQAYEASLSAVELAQLRVDQAQADVNYQVGQHGPTSAQAKSATEAYEAAQAELAEQEARTELAVSGVTQAMIDQANQALAAIDSGFAYQNSLNQLEDAQTQLAEVQSHLNDTNKDTRTSTEDVERAQLAVAEQTYRTALAFGQQQADMSGAAADSAEYARIVQETALQELYRLRDAAGPEMAGALSQQIAMLEASGVSLGSTAVQAGVVADRMKDLGHQVQMVPGHKGVIIDAPTADQRRRIEDLGYKVVTLPNGRVYVTADTGDAEAALEYLSRPRYTTITVNEKQGAVVRSGTGMTGGNRTERATGGSVWSGHEFLVGEEGPELVRFSGAGTVIPAGQTQQILSGQRTALAPPAATGPQVIYQHDTIVQTVGDPRAIAAAIDQRNRDREFLARVGG